MAFYRNGGNVDGNRPDVYVFGAKYGGQTFPYFDMTGSTIDIKSTTGAWDTTSGYSTITFSTKKKSLKFFVVAYSKAGTMSLKSITGCTYTSIPYSDFFDVHSDATPLQAMMYASGTLTNITGDITITMYGSSLTMNGCALYIWEDN